MSPERKAQLESSRLDFTCVIADDVKLRMFHLGRLGSDYQRPRAQDCGYRAERLMPREGTLGSRGIAQPHFVDEK